VQLPEHFSGAHAQRHTVVPLREGWALCVGQALEVKAPQGRAHGHVQIFGHDLGGLLRLVLIRLKVLRLLLPCFRYTPRVTPCPRGAAATTRLPREYEVGQTKHP
jgi:hypothetical protein